MVVLKIALIAVGAAVYILCGIGWDIYCNYQAKATPSPIDTVNILIWPVFFVANALVCAVLFVLRLISDGIRKFSERR